MKWMNECVILSRFTWQAWRIAFSLSPMWETGCGLTSKNYLQHPRGSQQQVRHLTGSTLHNLGIECIRRTKESVGCYSKQKGWDLIDLIYRLVGKKEHETCTGCGGVAGWSSSIYGSEQTFLHSQGHNPIYKGWGIQRRFLPLVARVPIVQGCFPSHLTARPLILT